MVSIELSEHALRDLKEIDQVLAKRIIEKILWLEQNFDKIVPERLHRELKNSYKLRVGDYRAVYSVHGSLIIIEAVGHRRDVYR
ncbi:hypothetical protein A3C86_03545 [Candidatus Kaiserbacteria bacterium RIFCSPHIGHO2_02_FULL_49_16]|uniref:Addiction module antitoxin RelB n=1 Tax=Candidatus Kaiserbacteria bacterium RIFCSPHIGHO2_02_FULL_49_16 TaxID=1798490 RepID=A0A1F6DA68_9BACT|nr:MAG: hypothetical protein A3C86_03545 [Candidatus Kaiserbacteria bacterium RIFCSPHIGHO2_02_FULL_49_16]